MYLQCSVIAIFILNIIGTKSELPELSDAIKDDLFKIYTGVALIERNVTREPVTLDQVKFFLFTRNNIENYTTIDPLNPPELENKKAKVVFIIHGWLENRGKQWYEDMKNAFLAKEEEYYVVQVDWSGLAHQGYLLSSYTTKDVGRIIGELVVNLHENITIPLDNFVIVGHSLGGQISGYVGKTVQELTNQTLPRIVALDPAGPFFKNRPEDERLNPNDARVVEVIHTNGGTFGFLRSCGTIDFFPNGGSVQPGCAIINLTDLTSVSELVLCNHQRSWKYYIEALRHSQEFQGVKCDDWTQFLAKILCKNELLAIGDLWTKETGRFFLTTNSEPPFYKTKKKSLWNSLSL